MCKGVGEISWDRRTSDAIALALRTGASSFTTPEIGKKTGNFREERNDRPTVHKKQQKLEDFSVEELEERMHRFVEQEEYELAAEIQKIIKKKTSSNPDEETKNINK